MSSVSKKGQIPVPQVAKDLPGEIRVACIKYVEHIVMYKLTRKEELALACLIQNTSLKS